MDVILPVIVVILGIWLGSIVYRLTLDQLFSRKSTLPETELPEEQKKRYACYQFANKLQLTQNKWHNSAIRSKTVYELVGVSICAAGPALVLLSAGLPFLEQAGLASATGRRVAELVVCIGVLVTLVLFRNPNRDHVLYRLRAELLRSHLHCLLAKVGPYSHDESAASQILDEVQQLSQEDVELHLRELEGQCARQSFGAEPLSTTTFESQHATAYLVERVGEQAGNENQLGYFERVNRRFSKAFRWSARLVVGAIVLAFFIGILRLCSPYFVDIDINIADFGYAFFGAMAVFLVSARAVMGWDSKAGLYNRQAAMLGELVASLSTYSKKIAEGDPVGEQMFRQHAARFESLMAREALDWKLIADRENFDVTP